MRKLLILPLFCLLLSCGGKNVATDAPGNNLDEPDKVLFDRAKRDLDKNKFTVARLTLQTLINTYPDSEFLPQAKYALAESFYRENSSGAMNQAEAEFKTMVETYPDSPLLDEAKTKLRAVQEVLADGVLRIGNFYLLRKSYPAAVDRYQEILKKYPDFSRAPDTLFNLAEAFRHANNPESSIYYARIVSEYPLSDHVNEAKERLTAMNQPIPEPNPVALARAGQAARDDKGILGKMFGVFSRRPPVPTDTEAASEEGSGEQPTDSKNGSGTFTLDPKVVQPGKAPAPAKK